MFTRSHESVVSAVPETNPICSPAIKCSASSIVFPADCASAYPTLLSDEAGSVDRCRQSSTRTFVVRFVSPVLEEACNCCVLAKYQRKQVI